MFSKTLALLLLILFCPYISFGLFSSDLSPIFLFVLFCFSLLLGVVPYKELILFFSLLIILLFYAALFSDTIALLSVLKFFVSILLSVLTFRLSSQKILISRIRLIHLKIISLLWLLSGAVTKIFPFISDALLTRSLDESNLSVRGFQGLTSEPSIYSISSSLLLLFTLMIYKHNYNTPQVRSLLSFPAILFIASVLLSKSVFGYSYFIVILVHCIFSDISRFDTFKSSLNIRDLWIRLFALSISIASITVYFAFNPSSRIYTFLASLISSPDILSNLASDSSFLFRFNSILVILNAMLPTINYDVVANTTGGITTLFFNFGLLAFPILFILIRYSATLLRAFSTIFRSRLLLILFLPLLIVGPLYIPIFWLLLPHFNLV